MGPCLVELIHGIEARRKFSFLQENRFFQTFFSPGQKKRWRQHRPPRFQQSFCRGFSKTKFKTIFLSNSPQKLETYAPFNFLPNEPNF